jgi:hypothetical protein
VVMLYVLPVWGAWLRGVRFERRNTGDCHIAGSDCKIGLVLLLTGGICWRLVSFSTSIYPYSVNFLLELVALHGGWPKFANAF